MRRKVFRRGWRRQRRSAECTSPQLCRVHEGVHYCVQQQQNRKPSVCPLHTQHLYGVWARPDSMFCDCAHMGSCWLRQPDRRRDVAQCSTIWGNAGFDCRQQAESLFQMVRGLNLGFRLDCPPIPSRTRSQAVKTEFSYGIRSIRRKNRRASGKTRAVPSATVDRDKGRLARRLSGSNAAARGGSCRCRAGVDVWQRGETNRHVGGRRSVRESL